MSQKQLPSQLVSGNWGRNTKATPPGFGGEGRWHPGATIKIQGKIWLDPLWELNRGSIGEIDFARGQHLTKIKKKQIS